MKKTALPIIAAIAAGGLVVPAAQAFPAAPGCHGVAKWAGDYTILQAANKPGTGVTLSAGDGAFREAYGPITFPVVSAADDVITLRGSMTVSAPQGTTTISDLKVLLNGNVAQLQGDYTNALANNNDVVLADIQLFKPESTAHTVGFGHARTTLTAEGSKAFGGMLAAGQEVMSFDVHGAWCEGTVAPAPEAPVEESTPAPAPTTEATPAPTTEATPAPETTPAPTEEATPDQDNHQDHHKRGPVYAAFYKVLHFLAGIFNTIFGGIFGAFAGLMR